MQTQVRVAIMFSGNSSYIKVSLVTFLKMKIKKSKIYS